MEWTLTHEGKRARRAGNELFVEGRRAHKNYVAVDPRDVADKLRHAGIDTLLRYGGQRRRRTFLSSPATCILEARGRAHGEYADHAIAYFDHRGAASIKIQAGALRIACHNAFTAPLFRLHHCSDDARRFADDPVPFFREAMGHAGATVSAVERFRGRPGGLNLIYWLRSQAPRLGATVANHFALEYSKIDGPSMWAAIQSLTAPSRRRLDDFAGRLIHALPADAEDVAPYCDALWN